jgi:small subunit ribosomal protein S7
MSRRGKYKRREILPDIRYNSRLVSRFINCIMKEGKKSIAERIFYNAMDIIKEKKLDPMETLKKAVENARPLLELKSRRVGGATYQIPVDVRSERGESLSIRWIIQAARQRKTERGMENKLASEIIDAANHTGGAIKKKEDTHRMAEANKVFIHFRW